MTTTYYGYHPSYLDWTGISTVSSGYATSEYVPVSVGAGLTQTWTGSGWSTTTDYRGTFYYTTDEYADLGSSLVWTSPVEQPALSIATATAPPAISTAGYILGWDGSDWTVNVNSIIPEGDGVVSLGSSTNKYKDVYASEGTIYLGIHSLSVALNDLQYDNAPIALKNGDNLYLTGILTSQNVSVADSITATDFYGNGASLEGVPTDLGSLSDVEVIGVTDGQSLVYNSSTGEWEPGSPTLPPDAVLSSLNVAGIVTFGENMEIFTQSFQGTTNGTPTFTTIDMSNIYKVESTLTIVLSTTDYTQDTCWFYNDGGTIRAEKPNGTPVSLNTGPIPNPDINVNSTYAILYDSFGDQLSIRCDRQGGGQPDPISAKIIVTGYLAPPVFVP